MQEEEIKDLIVKLERIKKMGYVKSINNRGKEGTIGILLDMSNNNVAISCKSYDSNNYITIFNATPVGKEKDQIKRLRDRYGYYDNLDFKNKVFKCSVQSSFTSFIKTNNLLKLKVDYEDEKIYLQILDKNYTLIDQKSYWTFDMLRKYYEKKAQYLILVKTWVKTENKINYFKYYDFNCYKLKDFNCLLKLIDEGIIRITFRINAYSKQGNMKNKLRDDGTSLELQELDYLKLYEKIY